MKSKVSIIIPVYNVEQYIEKMLLSLIKQDFKDWEAIIINDGSTDSSQRIIDNFASKDKRIKPFIKQNGGVSSARNMGMELASSEYVVFYDPDDYIPKNALRNLYNKAKANNADMVVGVMEEINLGDHLIYMHSQKLAKKNIITPIDEHFFGAWSVCNKMFSLEFLRKHCIKFEDLSNAEDGVFTFEVLKNEPVISGCDTIAYNYLKRPFWLEPSATQSISIKYLNGLLDSHDRILKSAEILAKKTFENDEQKSERYLEGLYLRFIEGEIINGFYRRIWRAGDDADLIYKTILERYNSYIKHIGEENYKKLMKRHQDIDLEDGLKSTEEMALSPKISIIITKELMGEKLSKYIDSLFIQAFPLFEIFINNNNLKGADSFKKCSNFHILNCEKEAEFIKSAISKSKGEYISFAKECLIYSKETLRNMIKIMQERTDLDFASMLVKSYDGKNKKTIPMINGRYGMLSKVAKEKGRLVFDSYITNKLIRKSSILKKNMKYIKLRRGNMIILNAPEYNSHNNNNKLADKRFLIKSKVYDAIDVSLNKMKRIITREDIDKIKGILGIK